MDKLERKQVREWLAHDLAQYGNLVHNQLIDTQTIDDRMKQLDLTHERIKVALSRIWDHDRQNPEVEA